MSIIIKGMDMPRNCFQCTFFDGIYCGRIDDDSEAFVGEASLRNPNCPLVEIPTPHGRLIDKDAIDKQLGVAEECEECKFWYGTCARGADRFICDILYDAPTILEAEG